MKPTLLKNESMRYSHDERYPEPILIFPMDYCSYFFLTTCSIPTTLLSNKIIAFGINEVKIYFLIRCRMLIYDENITSADPDI